MDIVLISLYICDQKVKKWRLLISDLLYKQLIS
jgi:hypothetical protein